MKDPKPCIFCGQTGGKSKEHFYPDWLGEFIESARGVHNVSTTLTQKGDSPKELTARSRRQGHLITKTFRVVCQSCNNGWMSLLENSVKKLLIAGVCSENVVLNRDEQLNLANWVCLKTMVCEHSSPRLASTPFKDRHPFFKDRLIPDYFRIYMGAHSTSSVTWLYRHSGTISFSNPVDPPLLDGLRRNMQTTTFIVGRFLFHVLAARVNKFELDTDLTYPGLTRLWPISSDYLNTANLRLLDMPQLGQVLNSFEAYLAHQKPIFVDPVI